MDERDQKGERPLQGEAQAREAWRGTDGTPEPDSRGHTLPASEDEDGRLGGGGSGDAPTGPPGAVPPPD